MGFVSVQWMSPIYTQLFMEYLHLLILSYLAILFGQTAADKCFDWKGNHSYITAYFSQTPLKGISGWLFVVLLLSEAITFLCAAVGALLTLKNLWLGEATGALQMLPAMALAGAWFSLLSIFLGQRIAKDYAAASATTAYLTFLLLASCVFVMPATGG
jgi:hypothetical protein